MTPLAFIHDLRFDDLPRPVVAQAKRCVLDLVGVAASGRRDRPVAHRPGPCRPPHGQRAPGGARLLLDGRRASPAGAAFAGASTIDAFDAHDGHPLTKGHAGVAVLPALLAVADAEGGGDGRDLLAALVLGYEVAIRAGIALHASVPDYHTSGAWNALGCAAVAPGCSASTAERHPPRARHRRISRAAQPDDALHRPPDDGQGRLRLGRAARASRRPISRADGFTGAPADHDRGRAESAELWSDLGRRWRDPGALFQAVPGLPLGAARDRGRARADRAGADRRHAPRSRAHRGQSRSRHSTPRCGSAHGRRQRPRRRNTGSASRSPPRWCGALGPGGHRRRGPARSERSAPARAHHGRRASRSSRGVFPPSVSRRCASRSTTAGCSNSAPTAARGDADAPLGDDELRAKFELLAAAVPRSRRAAIAAAVEALDRGARLESDLLPLLLAAPRWAGERRQAAGAA